MKYSTLIVTPHTLGATLGVLAGAAAVIDLKFSNVIVRERDLDAKDLRAAIEVTPKRQRV